MEHIEDKVMEKLSPKRWQHSLGVAETAQKLALLWGADPQKAYLAGILHDYAREIPDEGLISLAEAAGTEVTPADRLNPVVLHAKVSAILVHKELGVTDPEVLQAVAGHTLGGAGMSLLDKIIFLADMIEPGRDWPGVEKLRHLVYNDIDRAMLLALTGTITYLDEKNQPVHPLTLVTRDFILNEIKGRGKETKGLTSKELATCCAAAAQGKKARDILFMNLQGISLIADYFVICTGNNSVQVKAISEQIDEKLSEAENPPLRVEGYREGRWILMDFGSVIVHIFQEEERQYFNLERLWGDAVKTRFEDEA